MKKLLVANRSEIAIRVMRAARELGIRTVAVYSEADAQALHTSMADEAVCIGPGPAPQSYLDWTKVLDAAKKTGADAIHPGYGFLSERAEFVDACVAAGVTFIGPSANAMRRLGDKISSKQIAVEAEVPITPGFFEANADDEAIIKAAHEIGFPVMLKASAGGGGRGMRAVFSGDNLAEELSTARSEAERGFGDRAMMVEKLIQRPRHIETQIVADHHGDVVVFFERECSIQRRHQKLIEEAPSPVMTDDLWQRIREASIRLIRAANYTGAGTIEFMYDEASGEFYFLEVNARLQVEHPVTELITGVDLVHLQLKIAQGERLADLVSPILMEGSRDAIHGHAIEARVVAEDPFNNYMPSIGPILGWVEPNAPGIRVDSGYAAGTEVSPFYDSMIAKVIAHAPTRTAAAIRLREALGEFHILGIQTNIPFVQQLLADEEFLAAKMDTGFLGRRPDLAEVDGSVPEELAEIASRASGPRSASGSPEKTPSVSAWSLEDDFRIAR